MFPSSAADRMNLGGAGFWCLGLLSVWPKHWDTRSLPSGDLCFLKNIESSPRRNSLVLVLSKAAVLRVIEGVIAVLDFTMTKYDSESVDVDRILLRW